MYKPLSSDFTSDYFNSRPQKQLQLAPIPSFCSSLYSVACPHPQFLGSLTQMFKWKNTRLKFIAMSRSKEGLCKYLGSLYAAGFPFVYLTSPVIFKLLRSLLVNSWLEINRQRWLKISFNNESNQILATFISLLLPVVAGFCAMTPFIFQLHKLQAVFYLCKIQLPQPTLVPRG